MVLGYSLYYIALEWFAGLTWAIFMGVPLWVSSVAFQQLVPHAWAWAVGLHIFAWFMQVFPGHAWIEGRKPALLDSLFQVPGCCWERMSACLFGCLAEFEELGAILSACFWVESAKITS